MRNLMILSLLALLAVTATGCECCDWCHGSKMFAKHPQQPVNACYDPCVAPAPVAPAVPCCQ